MSSKTNGTLIILLLASATTTATRFPSLNTQTDAMTLPTTPAVTSSLKVGSRSKFATDWIQGSANDLSALTKTFSAMHSAIKRLRDNKPPVDAPRRWDEAIRTQVEGVSAAVHGLEQRMKGLSPAALSQTFRDALNLDAELLTKCVKQRKGPDLLRFLVEVRSSLELKVKFANASKGTAVTLIQLVVQTVRGSNEVNDYEIWYVPRGWSDVAEKYRRFDDLSSPAIMDLSAGNYLIWVKLAGREITERAPVTLGDDGKSKRRVTLAVP